jgi:hypothetical protein
MDGLERKSWSLTDSEWKWPVRNDSWPWVAAPLPIESWSKLKSCKYVSKRGNSVVIRLYTSQVIMEIRSQNRNSMRRVICRAEAVERVYGIYRNSTGSKWI